jgi:hypothetical protein
VFGVLGEPNNALDSGAPDASCTPLLRALSSVLLATYLRYPYALRITPDNICFGVMPAWDDWNRVDEEEDEELQDAVRIAHFHIDRSH